jgi:hypothetical protein
MGSYKDFEKKLECFAEKGAFKAVNSIKKTGWSDCTNIQF